MSKELTLANAQNNWNEIQAAGGLGLNRPTSLSGMLDQPIQLTNVSFRLQEFEPLKKRIKGNSAGTLSLANFEYYTQKLKYFDDFSTKFTELAVTFDDIRYTPEDLEEVKQFLAKQRILIYKEGATPPDMAEIGLFYRRAPMASYSSGQDAGHIPLSGMLMRKNQYRLSGVNHHTLAEAVGFIPQLIVSYGGFFVPEEKLVQKLIRSNGRDGMPYAYVPISMRASYRLHATDKSVAGKKFYCNSSSGLEIVTVASFPGYDLEEVQTRLLTPGNVSPIDPEVDCSSYVGVIPVSLKDLSRGGVGGYLEWMMGDGRIVNHIHKLLGGSLDPRWLLNVDAETDDKLSAIVEDEPDYQTEHLSLSLRYITGKRYRAGTQGEKTQHESLAWFLLYSGMPLFDEHDAVYHPSPKPEQSLFEAMGPSVTPTIPDTKIMHLQRYWENPRRAQGDRRLFVLDTSRKSLRKLAMYAAKSWAVYFQELVAGFEDARNRVIDVDADGAGILSVAIDQLHEMISYLDDVLLLDDWMGLSQKQTYLKARALRDRIGKFFVDPDGASLFYGMMGKRPSYLASHEFKVDIETFGSERYRFATMFNGEMMGDNDVTCSFNLYPEDLNDKMPSGRPSKVVEPATVTSANQPRVQAGVQVASPVEKESWVDRLFNYFFR